MASRQNQGLQIALIFFVMTTILLAVVVYFTGTSAAENADKLAKKEAELRGVTKARDAADTLANLLMAWIGDGEWTEEQWRNQYDQFSASSDTEVTRWVDAAKRYRGYFDQDMYAFSADFTDPKGWRTLPGYLLTTLKAKNTEIANANSTLVTEKKNFEAAIAAAQTQVAQAEQLRLEAEAAKTQVEQALRAVETTIRGEQATSLAAVTEARNQQQADKTTLDQKVAESTDLAASRLVSVEQLAAKVDEYEREEFDVPNGQITRVNPELGIVYINLGSLDNLPRTQVFSVYGQHASTFRPDGKKGEIRVRVIRDGHSAECEILNQDLKRPLLVGDNIFTPVWKPGRTIKYAIGGNIDMDGNGRFEAIDVDSLKSIIEKNGGEVVAYVDADTGAMQGAVDALTDFVVTGEELSGGDPALAKAVFDSSKSMLATAAETGVQTIYFEELLERFGYRSEADVERVGPGVQNEPGFAPRRPPARPSGDSSF